MMRGGQVLGQMRGVTWSHGGLHP